MSIIRYGYVCIYECMYLKYVCKNEQLFCVFSITFISDYYVFMYVIDILICVSRNTNWVFFVPYEWDFNKWFTTTI